MPRSKPRPVGVRVARSGPPKPNVEDVLPTARECLGLLPFATIKLSTPESHSVFELNDLPPHEGSADVEGVMPWEEGQNTAEVETEMAAQKEKTDEDALAETFKKLSGEGDLPEDHEQRGPQWYKARRFKLSASQVASAVRKSPFMSRKKLLYTKVYPKTNAYAGNTYTNWGTLHEPHAEEAFTQSFLTRAGMYTMKHSGFMTGKGRLWFGGFSPDGILQRREGKDDAFSTVHELVEYKCSAHHRSSPTHPYAKYWKNIPEHYLIQLQYSMHLARQREQFKDMERAWFVSWQPHALYVTHVPYMPLYAASLAEHASRFYHKRFVPACLRALKSPGKQTTLDDLVDSDSSVGAKRPREALK